MTIHDARSELCEAWAARPFCYRRVARASAVLLELLDYDVDRINDPILVVDNTEKPNGK